MAIIGGGVIGVSIAFELAADNLKVLVLDRQQPGREASWAAAGMLSPAPDSPRDLPLVPLSRESLRLYPDFVAAIEEESGKSVSYAHHGAMELFLAPRGEAERDRKVAEYRLLGLRAEAISLDAAHEQEKSLSENALVRAALRLSEEGTVEPRLLMEAILGAARNRGVAIVSDRPVTHILCERNRSLGVVAGGERIDAGRVVLAAGCFSSEIARGTGARLALIRPVRGQMLALGRDGFRLSSVLRSERGYLVPRRDGRIVVGSTNEEVGFDKRVTAAGMRKLLDAAIELCPAIAAGEILETWSGLRPGTPDDLPILGPSHIEGLLIATGHYRNGILLAPVTAKLLRDYIFHGCASPDAFDPETFSPVRFDRTLSERAELA